MNSNEFFFWIVRTKSKRGEIFFIYLFPPLDTCFDLGFKILGVEFIEYFFQVDLAIINKV